MLIKVLDLILLPNIESISFGSANQFLDNVSSRYMDRRQAYKIKH